MAKNSPRLFWIGVPERITRRIQDNDCNAWLVFVFSDFKR